MLYDLSALLDSGVIATHILQALQGYKLSSELKELKAMPNKVPVVDANGFVHSSFLFSTELIVKGIGNG